MKNLFGISYEEVIDSTTTLIKIPVEGQTPLVESQQSIDNRNYNMSERNGANAYIIPTDEDKVYLNFIPQKTNLLDSDLVELLEPRFLFYEEPPQSDIDLLALPDGLMFYCVSADSLPLPKEDRTYYIMMDGKSRKIPNYKTLEVMMADRGVNLLSVRPIEQKQCNDLPKGSPISDKSGAWIDAYQDQSNLERLAELEGQAQEAAATAAEASAAAAATVAIVKEEREAAKEDAEANKAAAEEAREDAASARSEAEAAQGDLADSVEQLLDDHQVILDNWDRHLGG